MTNFYIDILNMTKIMQVIGSFKLVLPQIELIQVFSPFPPITKRTFSSSTVLFSLRAHLPEGPSKPSFNDQLSFEGLTLELGQPRGVKPYHFTLPSIYSDNFFEELENLLSKLHNDPKEQFSIILQPAYTNGQYRTLGHSFTTNIQPKMNVLKDWLKPLIDTFAAQSASGEDMFTDATVAIIRNLSDLPEPQATPVSSSPANVEAIKKTIAETKKASDRARKRIAAPSMQAQTLDAVTQMTSKLDSMTTQIVDAIN